MACRGSRISRQAAELARLEERSWIRRFARFDIANDGVEIVTKSLHVLFTLLVKMLHDGIDDHFELRVRIHLRDADTFRVGRSSRESSHPIA